MNMLLSSPHWAQWVLNFLLLSSLFLTLFSILVKLVKSKSLPISSNIALCGMICLMLIPMIFPLVSTTNNIQIKEPVARMEMQTTIMIDVPDKESQGFPIVGILSIAGLIWVMGFGYSIGRSIMGFKRLKRLKGDLHEICDQRIRDISETIKKVFKIQKLPLICTSTNFTSPIIWGVLNPVIIIPENLYGQIDDGELKAILIHELAHIIHNDNKILLLQKVVIALNWYNPFAYLISREYSKIREFICDNYASLVMKPNAYARSLFNLAQKVKFGEIYAHTLSMALNVNDLKQRIKKILAKENKLKTKNSKILTLFIFIFALFSLGMMSMYKVSFTETINGDPSGINSGGDEKQKKGDKLPKLLKIVKAQYPKELAKKGIQGRVVVEAITDIYGKVAKVKIIKSADPLLNKPCIDAVKQWVYEPYIINGKPKPVKITVKLDFSLDKKNGKAKLKIQDEINPPKIKGNPKLIKRVKPVFPDEAIKAQIVGRVVVQATTDIYGKVAKIKILESADPLLNKSCIDAIKQWVYEPYIVNGQPIPVEFTVKLDFDLTNIKGSKKIKEPVKLGDNKPPRILKRSKPVFSDEAIKARIVGRVVVQATTDIYGKVALVKIISSTHNKLDKPCIDAIKQWVYEPYIINGIPTAVTFIIKLDFDLSSI